MQKILLSTTAALALLATSFTANAADLAQRPATYTKAPMMVAMYDWSGFYLGGNAGYGSSRNCWGATAVGGGTINDGCNTASGGVIGGQVGYRWQTGPTVFGVEAQGDWASLRASQISIINPTLTDRAKVDGLGLFTGQIGYSWNTVLLYVKGGAAVTSNHYDRFNAAGVVNFASSTRWGGTIGTGLEYAFAPNWSIGLEYDHLFMGDSNNSFSVPAGAAALVNRISSDIDLVTVRLNYKFGGPIVARY
jgi:outer membrane immunogenic protein